MIYFMTEEEKNMEPENRISNKALTVWKISGLISVQ